MATRSTSSSKRVTDSGLSLPGPDDPMLPEKPPKFSEAQMKQLQELLKSMLKPIHQRLGAIEDAIGPKPFKTLVPNIATLNSLRDEFSSLDSNTVVVPDATPAVDEATEKKQTKQKLRSLLSSLAYLFKDDVCPAGKFFMDPLSCRPGDPEANHDPLMGLDHWSSRLSYDYNMGDTNLAGDVLPIFCCYLDLYPREDYCENLVRLYIPRKIVQMLGSQIQKLTGHIVEPAVETLDGKQGLISFLAAVAPEGTPLKITMYKDKVDKSGKIVDTQRRSHPLGRFYKAAASNPKGRILGGVALLHVGASYWCPPNALDRRFNLPCGTAVDLKIEITGFHCLGLATEFVERID